MTDKTMPDEILAKQYGKASGGTYWSKPREDGKGTRYRRPHRTSEPEGHKMRITIPIPKLSYYEDKMQSYVSLSFYYFRIEFWYAPTIVKQYFYHNIFRTPKSESRAVRFIQKLRGRG